MRRNTRTDDSISLTPEAIREQYSVENSSEEGSIFERLFAPKTRALIVDVLVEQRGDPLTAQEIADMREGLSVSGFNRHREPLAETGVLLEAGKRGNAQTYAIDVDHPIAQALAMIDNLALHGETPQLIDEQFISESDTPPA